MNSYLMIFLVACLLLCGCAQNKVSSTSEGDQVSEKHRPLFHHSPSKSWMNDPNGMVFHDGEYHLFYQYNPDSTIWGPMHWGHAISKDLVQWEEQEIALFPDTLGTIFSGSAVVDKNNTAGFGKNALVAIFTHHNQKLEPTGKHQYQSLAYSNDKGRSWTKYEGNPVLPNPGIRDFRDPKVMWHEATGKWVMTLATQQTITFYGSPDLKNWERLSEFGEGIGVHDGVWECPDLFSFEKEGETIWVLLVSINPGGPNGGSATQYFVGDFNGETFSPFDTDIRWIDFGRDNYAGVTFSNTGSRRIFMGWMNNWDYANQVPTKAWRGANTFPRELDLKSVEGKWHIFSKPVKELGKFLESPQKPITIMRDSVTIIDKGSLTKAYRLDFTIPADKNLTLKFSNDLQEEVSLGFDAEKGSYFTDRTQAGNINFSSNFSDKQWAPRISKNPEIHFSILVDVASLELFADDGLTVMTTVFFPNELFDRMTFLTDGKASIKNLKFSPIKISKD